MLLRNFDYATKYFDYISKTELENNSNPPINGWYKFINESLSALLVMDHNLYFLYGEETFLITETYRVSLKEKSNIKNQFELIDGNKVLVRFSYPIPDYKLNISPFEYIDEGDFKWGDFIAKIVNNRERKRNFVMNLLESH
jgi:hypothetical protein